MAVSVVIGGSTGIGLVIAQRLSARGDDVVVTSRDRATAEAVAQTLGPSASGLALDLGKPKTIAAALADVQAVDNLVLTAIAQARRGARNAQAVVSSRSARSQFPKSSD